MGILSCKESNFDKDKICVQFVYKVRLQRKIQWQTESFFLK